MFTKTQIDEGFGSGLVCFCSSWYEESQVVDGLPVAETAFSMLFGVFQASTMSEDEFIGTPKPK